MPLTDRELIEINLTNDYEQYKGHRPLTPFLYFQFNTVNGEKCPSFGLSSCGYDIRLGNEFKTFKHQLGGCSLPTINKIRYPELQKISYIEHHMDNEYTINPGCFVLASSLEYFNMPEDVCAEVKDKSTWARLGIAVQNTFIEPGWKGNLTLEITNHNNIPVSLMVGAGIAQIIFHKLSSTPINSYMGDRKYQGQKGTTVAK